jgi:hopanoid biosynthesis associated protein HpnK
LKQLIINADDFGFTTDVNAGIVQAHRQGVLTSTTLMATGDAFGDAVRLARATPTLDIGCHLVLVQGTSVLTGRELPTGPRALISALARNRIDVYPELRAQIEKITACGLKLSHLDTHKHTHIVPTVFRAVVRLAAEFRIPYVRLPLDSTLPCQTWIAPFRRLYLRIANRRAIKTTDHFMGFRLTGSLNEASFAAAIRALPEGTTEFMCHPGYLGPDLAAADTRLKESRVRELEALTSPRIKQLINESKVRLRPFCAATLP